ncbi:MAG: methyltransferase domain-containing protein [Acidobacteria bacterium]|nr:methyltransferase domain-containing protein [Acidobacteriota bacterium]
MSRKDYNSGVLSRRDFIGALAFSALRGQEKKTTMFGDAEAYDQFMGRWSRLVAPLLLEFADIPNTGRVLDVGSGTGSLAFAIAARKPRCHVLGIDPSKEYVAYAISRNRVGTRANFEIGDAQQLRFADATFQSSLSLLVFNFIPDPGKALREVARVTKSGGRIAAAVWDYGAGMRMLRVFWDSAVSIDPQAEAFDEKQMPLCRAGELSELWKKAGLTSVDERPLDITMRFPSFADYWDPFLLGQGPAGSYIHRLERARLEILRGELKRRLQISAENVSFDLPARVWAVRGAVRIRG